MTTEYMYKHDCYIAYFSYFHASSLSLIGHFIQPNPEIIYLWIRFFKICSDRMSDYKLELSGQRGKKKWSENGQWPAVTSHIAAC